MKRLLSALAVTSCLLAGLPAITLAQNGLTLFSGVKSENQLPFRLDLADKPATQIVIYSGFLPNK